MDSSAYNTPDFNATEYMAMYPDLRNWWAGTIAGSENVRDEWNNNMSAFALDHWTTHGKAEGRHGRASLYDPSLPNGSNIYDDSDFNALEYMALSPDLQSIWAGNTPGWETAKADWHGDVQAFALDHWLNFGRAEGRRGRTSVYGASAAATATPDTHDEQQPAAPDPRMLKPTAVKAGSSTLVLAIAAATVAGVYFLATSGKRRPS